MDPFVNQEPVRVELPGGLWWEFKRRLAYGDKMAMRRHFIRPSVGADGQVSAQLAEMDLESANVRMLVVASLAWNFPGEGGEIAPITEANILRLDEETIVNPVLTHLARLYGPLDDAAKN